MPNPAFEQVILLHFLVSAKLNIEHSTTLIIYTEISVALAPRLALDSPARLGFLKLGLQVNHHTQL